MADLIRGRRGLMALIVLLASLRGALYASALPPWGLVDDEHHFHYIQHLAEQGEIPRLGQTYLSSEIVDSLFATRRWEVFHWRTPETRDPRLWGLEGHSYEGYQPPLFYALLAPAYRLLPVDVLAKVFALRWLVVGLSLGTALITFAVARALFPAEPGVAYAAALLLVLIPERTWAVSRINNDVLLELVAAAFVWVATLIMLRGLTLRRAQALGLLLGLGLLTKQSMGVLVLLGLIAFWSQRCAVGWVRAAGWAGGLALALAAPFWVFSWLRYGDPTGLAAYQALQPPVRITITPASLVDAAADLARYFWVVWWQGAQVGTHPALKVVYAVLLGLAALAFYGAARWMGSNALWNRVRDRPARLALDEPTARVLAGYMLVIGAYAAAVGASYFAGAVPAIQGRLLLPVAVPIVISLVWGLWSLGRLGRWALALGGLALVAADAISLFGNLLPYYYLWSAPGVEPATLLADGQAAWALFASRLLMDKPPGFGLLLPLLAAAYLLALAALPIGVARARLAPTPVAQPPLRVAA